MAYSLAVQVKYEDTLRRFNAPLRSTGYLDLDLNGLTEKIRDLFNFPIDVDLNLNYVDEDGDLVTLVDDDDLPNVLGQSLKFLRINVQLENYYKSTTSHAKTCSSSTPLRSACVQNLLPTGFDHLSTAVPEHLHEKLRKLFLTLTSLESSLNSVLGELAKFLSKACERDILPKPPRLDLKEENVTRGCAPSTHTLVDLNTACYRDVYPPRHVNVGPSFPLFQSGDDKKQNDCIQSVSSLTLGSTSRAAPLMPPLAGCPFNGISVANDSAVPPVVRHVNSSRTLPQADSSSVVFHRGVHCHGCGAHPIIGPRYQSKIKHDYDLCDICFAEIGNEVDYFKMDRPLTHRQLMPLPFFSGFPKTRIIPLSGQIPIPHAMRHCGVRSAGSKLDSCFIVDVNVLDGTIMAPSTGFTKIWRMRNSGTVAWSQGVRLMWTGGERFSRSDSVEVEIPQDGLPVGGEIDIAADFTSPELPGRYVSFWKMTSLSGIKFGQLVWVLIQVDASLQVQDPQYESSQSLNLNLPPYWNGSRFSGTVDKVDPPVVDVGHVGAENSMSVLEPVNSVAVEQTNEQNRNFGFPISNNLLAGNGVLAPPSPGTSSPILYPIIGQSVNSAPLTEEVLCADGPASPDVAFKLDDDVETSLLKELEQMGFKQIDLNKEILSKNEYDMKQSVDDLCGVAEWDPILEELQEMVSVTKK